MVIRRRALAYLFNFRRSGLTLFAVVFSLSLLSSIAFAQSSDDEALNQTHPGYFPTITEDILLRGAADARYGNGVSPAGIEGPDGGAQTATGLFRYYDAEPDFYQRNQDLFRPINKGLGIFTPHNAWSLESRSRPQNVGLTVDSSVGLLTRSFEPELAHVKAGPLYFDLLYIGAGMLYSDFNGRLASSWSGDDEDGFAAYTEIGVRGVLRITDSMYISAVASVIYLPFENKVGLRFGNGAGLPLVIRFTWMETLGQWEILFYDQFGGATGLDFLVNADSAALDRAGRYYYGFVGERSSDFFSDNNSFFSNSVGLSASRPVFDDQWRLGLGYDHTDVWRSYSFDDHGPRDWFGIWLQYEGSIIPFAPRFSYQYFTTDGYHSLLHSFQMALTGRLTENITWNGSAGYAFSTGDQTETSNFIWDLAIGHTLTRSTYHELAVGEGYFYNEFQTDTRSSTYIRYSVTQEISSNFNMRMFAQYSYQEASYTDQFPVRDRFGAGLLLNYFPLDFTGIRAMAFYEQADQADSSDEYSRWLYRVELTQQLGMRLTGEVFYQYEESNSSSDFFTEHFAGVSLRRYF